MANAESGIQNRILLKLSESGVLAYRQMVGKFRSIYGNSVVKVGINGMSDIGAIVTVTVTEKMVGKRIGIAAQIEVKTDKGRESSEQKTWGKIVKHSGGLYIVARSDDECTDMIKSEVEKLGGIL